MESQQLSALLCLALTSLGVIAEDEKSLLIAKVTQAYGGDKLVKANNLIINESYKSAMIGQSETPQSLNLRKIVQTSILDFESNTAEVTQKVAQREIDFYIRKIYKNGHYYNINLVNNSYPEPQTTSRFQATGYTMLINDIGLARLLIENPSEVSKQNDIVLANITYGNLEMKLPNSLRLSLYIDKTSGLIRHSIRHHHTYGEIRTDFSSYQQVDGFTFASETEVFYGNELAMVTLQRDVQVNQVLENNYAQIESFHQQSPALYPVEMTVRNIGENVYLVGKGAVHSIFFVEGDLAYGAESYAGVMDRFKALEKQLNKKLKLHSLVVTHHHSDHISGINELATSDAQIVTVAEHLPILQEHLNELQPLSRFTIVDQTAKLAHAKVQVFDIATAHSEHNLVFYIPAEQLLFVADHYRSSYKEEEVIAFTDLLNFRNAIDHLPVSVKVFASAHGVKLLDYQTLVEATDNYQAFNCQQYASICY